MNMLPRCGDEFQEKLSVYDRRDTAYAMGQGLNLERPQGTQILVSAFDFRGKVRIVIRHSLPPGSLFEVAGRKAEVEYILKRCVGNHLKPFGKIFEVERRDCQAFTLDDYAALKKGRSIYFPEFR